MFKKFNFEDFLPQVFSMIQVMIETPFFIKENKLWNGFFEYKWIGMMMIMISVLFSWYLLGDLWGHLSWDNIEQLAPANTSTDMSAMPNVIDEGSKHTMFSGGTKYLLLILLEVIIFYFCIKTLSILTKEKSNPTFKEFYKAEIRMIKLMGWTFVKGIAVQVMISLALSLLGFKELTATAMFFVYAYFIGYAFLDNYNEQFSFKLKQSQTIIRQHLGAAFILGLVVTLLLYIPLVGPLLAPVFGGIAASIYGFRYSLETTEVENVKMA
ncbi:MAG: hypothetical protein ACJATF_002722 [Flavobacteriales bacterium]|jgi:hypothetical protein